MDTAVAEPNRMGRKRDHSRDGDILDAALEVLAETGYDGMTIDMVASRARAGKATLYRRWESKAELVIDAVACMKKTDLDVDNLPDTGTLRGDLIGMIKTLTIQEGERKLRVMSGLASLISRSPELAETARAAIIEPRLALNRTLMQRAKDRGEIPADANIELVAMIAPAMISYRVLMLGTPSNREFMVSLIDTVILPALGIRPQPGEVSAT